MFRLSLPEYFQYFKGSILICTRCQVLEVQAHVVLMFIATRHEATIDNVL